MIIDEAHHSTAKTYRKVIEYVKKNLTASRIDLGVFENNEAAKHCYEAAGFREYQRRRCEMPIGTWDCIDMEIISGDIKR